MDGNSKCPYGILGISPSASASEIEEAYRRSVKRYHPDLNDGCEKAAGKFRSATAAVQELRQLQEQSLGGMAAGAAHSRYNPSSSSSSQKRYQYGAHYSSYLKPAPHLRRARGASAGKMGAVVGIGLIFMGGAAATITYDTSQRETAYNNWVARDEARKLDRASRPAIGKGRRSQHPGASPT